jgi:O-antigen/teichoic acid export membrane protein
MSGVGNRAAILTLSRLANYGLMLISPIILVRLLTVEQFGEYREFLLYASVLQSIAVFSINDSLLYCIPAQPRSRWRTVRQTSVLIGCSSLLTVLALTVIDRASGGHVVGTLLLPLCAFTLLAANLDFWDYFWVATDRAVLVFVYAAARLGARVAVATVTAALTRDVRMIVWALVALEGARLIGVAVVVAVVERSSSEPKLDDPWREQLRYCVPSGAASVLAMLNRNLSSLVVTKVLGAVALAQYTIGRYGEPVVVTLRNSVSSVVLPEMVRRERGGREASLALWQQATVVNTILLFPVIVLIERYARPLVILMFGRPYAEAAVVLQLYMLVVVRECFDFAPALRARNRTRPLVESNAASIIACGALLAVLVPMAGVAGAMLAFAVGAWVDAAWLTVRTQRHYRVGFGKLIPWSSIGRVAAAALIAGVVLLTSAWRELLGPGGMVLAAAAYFAVFCLLVLAMKVAEGYALLNWLRRLVPGFVAASRKA